MRPWSAPVVPTLPGTGPALRLFDSRDGVVRPTTPGKVATMYVCGITPYDAAHLGHAATYVAFDLLARAWMDAGHDVYYVQNVTDIDDPLLVRAAETGVDWKDLATREIDTFRKDMTALRLVPPREFTGAVESIPQVIDYIVALQKAGAVYDVDGDLYFRVHADYEFGSLSHLTRDQMLAVFAERGGDPGREGKEDPLDCLLWRAARPGEPSWESDLGPGRPGWHIECVAIAVDALGMSFDVQGGGSDLIFPHHEMGAAEAHIACDQRPYARHYVHSGMVALDGEKMSKSRGNLVFVHHLLARGVDPMAIRLAILSQHYRSDWEWTPELLEQGVERLDLWRRAVGQVDAGSGAESSGGSGSVGGSGDEVIAESTVASVIQDVRACMANDLDAPGALGRIDSWAREVLADSSNQPAASGSATGIRDLTDALLGVSL